MPSPKGGAFQTKKYARHFYAVASSGAASGDADGEAGASGSESLAGAQGAPGRAAVGVRAGAVIAAADVKKAGAGDSEGPPKWAPAWAVDMHPALQAAASVGLYFFHMVSERRERRGVAGRLSCYGDGGRELHG